jgi:hypothetical protein
VNGIVDVDFPVSALVVERICGACRVRGRIWELCVDGQQAPIKVLAPHKSVGKSMPAGRPLFTRTSSVTGSSRTVLSPTVESQHSEP